MLLIGFVGIGFPSTAAQLQATAVAISLYRTMLRFALSRGCAVPFRLLSYRKIKSSRPRQTVRC